MYDYQKLNGNVEFKNLISGPAPVGRILNYIILAGNGKLKHKNGYRELNLKDNIASAWCLEFMVGLGLCSHNIPDVLSNTFKVDLSKKGSLLFDKIKDFNGKFDESNLNKCKFQLWNYNFEAYILLKDIFKNSYIYKNLYAYVKNNNIFSIKDNVFFNEYYSFFLKHYTGEEYSTSSSTGATTGENRVPSVVQLCEFFGYVIKDSGVLLFNLEDVNIMSTDEENLEREKARLESGENVILYGVPGAGKSWTIDNEYSNEDTIKERVVFHPDYTYSDFVGQILPQSKDGDVTYDFVPGPFTKIMKEAYYNPTIKYILVIEEINRGNAPAIFGDIFQLLDRHQSSNANLQQKKGESVYGIINADVAKIMYNDPNHEVKIPSNLSIICTMNTSDQNVFTLDTAFQRRWNMRLIENDFKDDTEEDKKFAETNILDTGVTWKHFCNKINDLILDKNQNMTSSEDKRLGVHFVHVEDLIFDNREESKDNNERITAKLQNRRFPEKVIKYLWDDAFKFYRDEIFKGEFNSLEKVIREFMSKKNEERFNIFKDNIKAEIISKPEQR